MRIRDLEYFVAVCDIGSINRASAALHIAQPALGLVLRRLEDEFGAELFVRHSRGVTPTPQGEELRAWAQDVLQSHRRVRDRIRLSKLLPHHLRIGLPPSAAALMATNIPAVSRQWLPGTSVQLLEEASHVLVDYVATNALDLALSFETPGARELHAQPVLRQALYCAARPGEFGPNETIPFASVLERDLVISAMPASVRYVVENEAKKIGRRLRITHELKSTALLKDFVTLGVGSAILPLSSMAEEVAMGRISVARIVEPELTRTLSLVRRKGSEEGSASAIDAPIIEYIRSALPRKLPEGISAH